MRHAIVSAIIVAVALAAAPALRAAPQDDPQRHQPQADEPQKAQPRQGDQTPSRARPRSEPQRGGPARGDRAQPRSQPQRAQPRPAPPPPHVTPPDYWRFPRRYAFPPVSLHLGFYYHPYFGFYYGPYYGPFYPYPGLYEQSPTYSAAALRTLVTPRTTEIYIDGYYAGLADDFDGIFQRLYVPAGNHEIELRLDGYEGFAQRIYVARGDTLEVRHQMRPLAPREAPWPLPAPRPLPPEWTAGPPSSTGTQPASPYGILSLRVDPADAQIFVDDEAWQGMLGRDELTIHMPPGWHHLEVRKDGYRPFSTDVELTEGNTTKLGVKLER
jgi:PEGA domain